MIAITHRRTFYSIAYAHSVEALPTPPPLRPPLVRYSYLQLLLYRSDPDGIHPMDVYEPQGLVSTRSRSIASVKVLEGRGNNGPNGWRAGIAINEEFFH